MPACALGKFTADLQSLCNFLLARNVLEAIAGILASQPWQVSARECLILACNIMAWHTNLAHYAELYPNLCDQDVPTVSGGNTAQAKLRSMPCSGRFGFFFWGMVWVQPAKQPNTCAIFDTASSILRSLAQERMYKVRLVKLCSQTMTCSGQHDQSGRTGRGNFCAVLESAPCER